MKVAPPPPQHIVDGSAVVDGRVVVDELPPRVGLLPGEVELVAQHLLDALDAIFAGGSSPRAPPP